MNESARAVQSRVTEALDAYRKALKLLEQGATDVPNPQSVRAGLERKLKSVVPFARP